MLNDAICFKQIYIVCGYTDMRYGIDSLAAIIKSKLVRNPCVPDTLYFSAVEKRTGLKDLYGKKMVIFFYMSILISS